MGIGAVHMSCMMNGNLFMNRRMRDPVMLRVMRMLHMVFDVMCRLGVMLVLTGFCVDRERCQYANQK